MSNTAPQGFDFTPPDIGPPPPQMKEFDFFIGNWTAISKTLAPDGTVTAEHKGKWDVEHRNGGRIVFDECTRIAPDGTVTSCAITLRTFCPATDQWEMVFGFSLQPQIPQTFRGRFVDGEGHFDAALEIMPNASILAKVRFYDIQKDSFEWSMHVSLNKGENWFLAERISGKRVV